MLRFTAIYHDRAPLCSPTETPPSADKQNKTHFCIYYILCGKHAFYTIYSAYRSKTVVKNFLYATICHDLPPIRRIRSPAEAPAVADKQYLYHKSYPHVPGIPKAPYLFYLPFFLKLSKYQLHCSYTDIRDFLCYFLL